MLSKITQYDDKLKLYIQGVTAKNDCTTEWRAYPVTYYGKSNSEWVVPIPVLSKSVVYNDMSSCMDDLVDSFHDFRSQLKKYKLTQYESNLHNSGTVKILRQLLNNNHVDAYWYMTHDILGVGIMTDDKERKYTINRYTKKCPESLRVSSYETNEPFRIYQLDWLLQSI